MGALITLLFGVCINLFFSKIRVVDKHINKDIKTFKVIIGDTILNKKLGVSITEMFKSNVTEMLKDKYKLKVFNVEDGESSPNLLLHYFIEEYSLNDIKEKEDSQLVKFEFTLVFEVQKVKKSIRNKSIEFEIKKTESKNLNNIVKKITEHHLPEFVNNYLSED